MSKSITADSCKFRNKVFEHQSSELEVKQMLKAANEATEEWNHKQKALAKAVKDGDGQAAGGITLWLLTSDAAKLAGAMCSACNRELEKRPTLESCFEIAKSLDLTQPIPESAWVSAKLKSNLIDWRPIASFGDQHRSAQQMVAVVLKQAYIKKVFQVTDVGLPKAMHRIRVQIDQGCHYFGHLDIRSFYQNFRGEKLIEVLPLPSWAVEYVVLGRHVKWVPRGSTTTSYKDLTRAAHRGIPQGSTISPLVAKIECARLGLSSSLAATLSNYADDFLLLADSAAELKQRMVQVVESVQALPGGHFILKTKSDGHLEDGCDFLGHHIKLADGKAQISPSFLNLEKLYANIGKFLGASAITENKKYCKSKAIQAAGDALAYLDAWKSSFRECEDLEERYLFMFREEITELLDKVGATVADVLTVKPKMKFDVCEHIGDNSP